MTDPIIIDIDNLSRAIERAIRQANKNDEILINDK